jgi:uncharacterized protein (DUF1800 family)
LFLATGKSLVAAVLSVACILALGVDLPLPASGAAAVPASHSAKDKKQKQDPVLKGLPITELTVDEAILHALNRLAYGPRPGDVERVRQMGLAKWIEQQLNPNSIDDKAVEARLESYPTLGMSSASLLAQYPQPKQAEKQAAKQAPVQGEPRPSDPAAAIVARDMQASRARARVPGQEQASRQEQGPTRAPSSEADDTANVRAAPSTAPVAVREPDAASPMKQDPSLQANIATRGAGGKRDQLSVDPNMVPRAIADDSKKPQRVVEELAMAKMTQAIYSQRQLQQIMDDFWFNHFNVFAGKGDEKWLVTSYERDVIQPHALGKFKDLLTATAKSPAMLFYLDNFLALTHELPNARRRNAPEDSQRAGVV